MLNSFTIENVITDHSSFPGGSHGEESTCNAGDLGSVPGSGRSSGEGNGSLLKFCCLENPIDRGTWQAIVRGFERVRHD